MRNTWPLADSHWHIALHNPAQTQNNDSCFLETITSQSSSLRKVGVTSSSVINAKEKFIVALLTSWMRATMICTLMHRVKRENGAGQDLHVKGTLKLSAMTDPVFVESSNRK